MRLHHTFFMSAVMAGLLCIQPALAQLAATATITSAPNGANFDYTIALTNTGSSDIGTFWFAWTPPGMPIEYDFLPAAPTSTGGPAGWAVPASLGFPGYSIENYNVSGSAIAPGQTANFTFTSSDSPPDLQASTFGFPNTTSFIYAGMPEEGATAEVSPVFLVPEPALLLPVVLTAIVCAATSRRRRIARLDSNC